MLEMCDILNEGTAEMPHFDPHGKTMLDALKTDLAIECARCDGRHIELAENDAYDGCVREACHRMKVKKCHKPASMICTCVKKLLIFPNAQIVRRKSYCLRNSFASIKRNSLFYIFSFITYNPFILCMPLRNE